MACPGSFHGNPTDKGVFFCLGGEQSALGHVTVHAGLEFLARQFGKVGILLFLTREQTAGRDPTIDTGLQGIGVDVPVISQCCAAPKGLGQEKYGKSPEFR